MKPRVFERFAYRNIGKTLIAPSRKSHDESILSIRQKL